MHVGEILAQHYAGNLPDVNVTHTHTFIHEQISFVTITLFLPSLSHHYFEAHLQYFFYDFFLHHQTLKKIYIYS